MAGIKFPKEKSQEVGILEELEGNLRNLKGSKTCLFLGQRGVRRIVVTINYCGSI